MSETQLGIFAKHWLPGAVKTRLAADIGDLAAANIYRHFVETLLQRLAGLADKSVVGFWPPDAREAFEKVAAGWLVTLQSDGDLGQRMHHYFQNAFDSGRQRVVLIGSDSPNLPIEFIERAFEALQGADVVLGPTPDGGYYLIGLRLPCPEAFTRIPWSAPQVWDCTLNNIRQARYSLTTLPSWYDIDERKDLVQLQTDLATTKDAALLELRNAIERELQTAGRFSE